MKNTKISFLIPITLLLVMACNNKEKKSTTTLDAAVDKAKKEITSSSFDSPCELIGLADIKNIFAVAEVPIETEDKVLTFPTCIYKWEDGQVFSIKEMAGQQLKMGRPSEVLIVMVKGCTEDMYNRSTKVYKQPQVVPDLGEMAVWDSRMSQLSFLSHSLMFHVHVKVSNDDQSNMEKAIEISNLIATKL
tara:strand:- start:78565 stop:79134 length:570 start_codon:yes stop_codon:yes gene_type:complete